MTSLTTEPNDSTFCFTGTNGSCTLNLDIAINSKLLSAMIDDKKQPLKFSIAEKSNLFYFTDTLDQQLQDHIKDSNWASLKAGVE